MTMGELVEHIKSNYQTWRAEMTFDEWFGSDDFWTTRVGEGYTVNELKDQLKSAWEAAVTAERERCAKVAEAVAEKVKTLTLHDELSASNWASGASSRVAERIRKG